ncbi:MAG: HNH endonuclease [Nitrososphaera sp.]|nr:HNH endonuclease [Nitrososphaera sp.]
MSRKSKPLVERFWAKVEKTDTCWNWTAGTDPDGYGVIRLDNWKIQARAPRVAWEMENGVIPNGMMVRHKCDNPKCVRVDHLELGTALDNKLDSVERNRHASGEGQGRAKLSWLQVEEIRRRYIPHVVPLSYFAAKYGVSIQTVYRVTQNKNWVKTVRGQEV